jgi:hypothetical protein
MACAPQAQARPPDATGTDAVKLFKCQACGQLFHFENTRCESCGRTLGYLPERGVLSALEPEGGGAPRRAGMPEAPGLPATLATGGGAWRAWVHPNRRYHFCANAAHDACNWLVEADAAGPYCRACRHNRTVPDLSVPVNLLRWRRLELAKHRLFYTLI